LSPIFAVSSQENVKENDITIYSPSFPNAYIEVEDNGARSMDNMKAFTITVYVEESYDYDENNNLIITTSKLLSKEEVIAIGEDNFSDSMEYPIRPLSSVGVEVSSPVTRGKLTLSVSASCVYINDDYDYEYEVYADARWSSNVLNTSSFPAKGNDFLSLAWSGGYSCYEAGIFIDSAHGTGVPYNTLCAAEPNALRVWEFPEQWPADIYISDYAEKITMYATLARPMSVEYNGYDEAVIKYIHTYQQFDGSISVEMGDTITPTIYLDNVEKQWSIVCVVSKIAP